MLQNINISFHSVYIDLLKSVKVFRLMTRAIERLLDPCCRVGVELNYKLLNRIQNIQVSMLQFVAVCEQNNLCSRAPSSSK